MLLWSPAHSFFALKKSKVVTYYFMYETPTFTLTTINPGVSSSGLTATLPYSTRDSPAFAPILSCLLHLERSTLCFHVQV